MIATIQSARSLPLQSAPSSKLRKLKNVQNMISDKIREIQAKSDKRVSLINDGESYRQISQEINQLIKELADLRIIEEGLK